MPSPVVDGMVAYLQREVEIGGYEASAESRGRLEGVYDSIARLVGSKREEIALAENATLAWQRAFYSLRFGPGDRILISSAEFAANYVALLQVARRTGARVEVIPEDAYQVLDPEALERMIDKRVRLIAITWIPTNGGLVNPAEAVGRIARAHSVPYLLDACQAVGQIPVNVRALGCDMLTATGRKFLRGPRGTGFLYMRDDFLKDIEPAMIDLFGAHLGLDLSATNLGPTHDDSRLGKRTTRRGLDLVSPRTTRFRLVSRGSNNVAASLRTSCEQHLAPSLGSCFTILENVRLQSCRSQYGAQVPARSCASLQGTRLMYPSRHQQVHR